jgi:hypothetical protein
VVAIKDVSHSDWESVALANNPRFLVLVLVEGSRRSSREEGGISVDDIRNDLGLNKKRRRPAAKDREEP